VRKGREGGLLLRATEARREGMEREMEGIPPKSR